MKLLLHTCCGPCALYPLESVIEAGHDVTMLYLNPNIQPKSEWQKRFDNVKLVADHFKIPLMVDKIYLEDEYVKRAQDENRCLYCYDLRLEKVFAHALASGFEAFSTTLLVSPYQNREQIVERGKALETDSMRFLADDWRPGYRKGQEQAKALGLYRQRYCGCLPSIEQSRFKEEIRARHAAEASQDRVDPREPESVDHK